MLGLSLPLAAAPTLDTSFGTNGTLVQPFPIGLTSCGGDRSTALFVGAKRDLRILANGAYIAQFGNRCAPFLTSATAQYSLEGTLDSAFGNEGLAYGYDSPTLVQRDNRVVSTRTAGLMRQNSDGSPEQGFVTNGAAALAWFTNYFFTGRANLAQQANGKIVAAGSAGAAGGYSSVALVRFNVDGTLDLAFNQTGGLVIPLNQSFDDSVAGLTIQPDGKLVAAGSSTFATSAGATYGGISLYRYNPDGTPDVAFGNNGRTTATASDALGPYGNYVANGVVLQPDGRLIVFGSENRYVAADPNPTISNALLLGFTSAGALDGTFGIGGAVRIFMDGGGTANGALMQPDGKLLVNISGFGVGTDRIMRFNRNGSTDTTFGNAGVLISPIMLAVNSIALQADGNLILGGISSDAKGQPTFALQRFISAPMAAIEYYNASLDHYFLSMNPQEVGDLDLGVHPGWVRTGLSFLTYGSAASAAGTAANPVCRFYIPPQHGDSHFFSADPAECAVAREKITTDPNFSGYVEETPNTFYIGLPDKTTGACPANTTPVHRLWNQGAASNHRYTADVVVKNQMIASGWVAEGYGPNAVDMCAPQ